MAILWLHELPESPLSLILGLSLAVVPLVYLFQNRKSTLKRSCSFTSQGMFLGCFPPHVNVPETIINAAIFFETPPSEAEMIEKVIQPMLEFQRLCTIPQMDGTFLPCPTPIDPAKLLRCITIDDDSKLYDTIFEHIQDSLARKDLPWWEFLLIRANKQSCVVLRIHHGLADGISLVAVFDKIVETPTSSSIFQLRRNDSNKKKSGVSFVKRTISLVQETIHVLTLAMSKYDAATAFSKSTHGKMVHSNKRSYCIFPTVDLAFIKQLKDKANVTVNDVLMAAVSSAIYDYCKAENCPVIEKSATDKLQCRALLPVALPRDAQEMEDPATALRNQWCLVSTDLALGVVDPLERLQAIHKSTQQIKSTPRAYLQLLIQNTIPPLLPLAVARQNVYDVFTRHSLVFSNVPGPTNECRLAGQVATGVQMFYANLIPQIGFLSYNGKIFGNLVMDPESLPRAERLATFYAKALLKMAERLDVSSPPVDSAVVKAAQGVEPKEWMRFESM